jgi:hypothetical protein
MQFISLYGGLVLIVEGYIQAQLAAANQTGDTEGKNSIIYALIYLCNGAVVGWPIIQLLKSPLEYFDMARQKIKALASGKAEEPYSDEDDKAPSKAAECQALQAQTHSIFSLSFPFHVYPSLF